MRKRKIRLIGPVVFEISCGQDVGPLITLERKHSEAITGKCRLFYDSDIFLINLRIMNKDSKIVGESHHAAHHSHPSTNIKNATFQSDWLKRG